MARRPVEGPAGVLDLPQANLGGGFHCGFRASVEDVLVAPGREAKEADVEVEVSESHPDFESVAESQGLAVGWDRLGEEALTGVNLRFEELARGLVQDHALQSPQLESNTLRRVR